MRKCKDCEYFMKDCEFSSVDRQLGLNGNFVACGHFKKGKFAIIKDMEQELHGKEKRSGKQAY